MQAKDSIFKMKTGLRPILQKSSSPINLNFIYKETKSTSTGTGDDNFAKITALQMLQIPLGDLEVGMMGVFIKTEPLMSRFTTFQTTISAWNLQLMNDVTDCWGKLDDAGFILSKIRNSYYKTDTVITVLKKLITEMKADTVNRIDPTAIAVMQASLTYLNTVIKDLAKYAVVEKPTKDFEFVTLNFLADTCLFLPCIKKTNVTLFPAKYDLQLSGLCHDQSQGPYDIWQTEVSLLQDQSMGNFLNFRTGDKLFLCLSKKGVATSKLQFGVKRFNTETRGVYIMQNGVISISKKDIKLFGKYEFSVTSSLDFTLKNWEMISMRSAGKADSTSSLTKKLQTQLDDYSAFEYTKLTKRVKDARNTITQSLRDTSFYINKIKREDRPKVEEMRKKLEDTKTIHKQAVQNFKRWEAEYDRNRQRMLLIEKAVQNKCTIKNCPFQCINIPKCKICQETWVINKSIPSCQRYLEDRSYKYLKSERDTCFHIVKDRTLKYTGNCKEPGPEPAYAQNVIDRLNNKLKKNISLTLGDAYALESINKEKGRELRLQIEKKLFFDNFPRRLTNCLLTEEEFKKLTSYTNQTFADKTKKKMQDIKNTKILSRIAQKLNESVILTEVDYQELRRIDPKLEKNIRKSKAISDITKQIQLTGNVTEEDLAKLDKIAPEYSKNITEALKKQEIQRQVLQQINKKMANGTLSPEDIKALKDINPHAAAKLETALKEQLAQKVKEMENKLKTVKGAIDQGLNSTGFKDLQGQLNMLSGSLKPYDKETLKNLQEKIRRNNATTGSIFEKVYERLDLAYDIKNATGNSHDLQRVFNHFFAVLPKFDVPMVLQRSSLGVLKGLHHIQEWFQISAKIINQACERSSSSNDRNMQTLINYFTVNIKLFHDKMCKSTWIVGVKIQAITDICIIIAKVEAFSRTISSTQLQTCSALKSNVINPLQNIVGQWKDARESMEKLNKQQWKKSKLTAEMLSSYETFSTALHKAFSTELGKSAVSLLSEDEIFINVETSLTDDNNGVSLAELEILHQLLTSIVQGMETLPNLIKQNRQAVLIVETAEKSNISSAFRKLTNYLLPFLSTLCRDKKPESNLKFNILPVLISRSMTEMQLLLSSNTISALLKYSQRFNQFAKNMLLHTDAIKNSMLPCKLRQKQVDTGKSGFIDEALDDLKAFIDNTSPLHQKRISDLSENIKKTMASFDHGLTSPIGKLLELMSNFVKASPTFNIPMIITLSPKVSSLALISFEDYMLSAQKFFDGIDDVMQQCKDSCSPQDIFGKSNLANIADKLDRYFEPVSKNISHFLAKIKLTPKGFGMLTASIAEIRTALQTISKSDTGFSKDGITNIINAFKTARESIGDVRKNTKDFFNSFTGALNKDVVDLKSSLSTLGESVSKLYEYSKGKLRNMRLIYEKIELMLERLSSESSKDSPGALVKRLRMVKDSASIVTDVGSQFEVMYGMNLHSVLNNYIDTSYAPNVATQLDDIRKRGGSLLNNTKLMSESIGIALPVIDEGTIFGTDISDMILGVANAMGARKSRLAKALTLTSEKISRALDSFSQTAENIVNRFLGGVSKYKDSYEELKRKLEKYGKMYDEIESTIEVLRNKPLSKIGDVKNAADELIGSIKDYDITQLLSADPEIVPRKIKEMQRLFNETAAAFVDIDVILKKCNVCNVDNIFGYKYMKSLSAALSNTFDAMFNKLHIFAERIGETVEELKDVKIVVKKIKNRFDTIRDKQINVDTFKDISSALLETTNEISVIQNGTRAVVKILFKKDLDFQVIGGTINNVLSQFSKVMNTSHVVAKNAQKVYDKALALKSSFLDLKKNASGLVDGPIMSRISMSRVLAEKTKELIMDFPGFLDLSRETLESAGINGKWLQMFGGQIESLTDSIGNVLEKTDKVLNAADVVVNGYEDIKSNIPTVQNSFKKLYKANWNQVIPAAEDVVRNLGNVFNLAINITLKSADALNTSFTRNDLKSRLESVVSSGKLAKYVGLYKNVSIAMERMKHGPIDEIGKLTDIVGNFVDSLQEYDFGKMLLQNPESLRKKLLEFEQLTSITGGILRNISQITGLCKVCDASSIFGKGFIHSFAGRLESTFEKVGKNIFSVIDRANLGLQGLGKVIGVTKRIAGHFKDLGNGELSRGTFDKAAEALLRSAVDVRKLGNGSADIFNGIFNGNNDMKYLLQNFEGLVSHVSSVLNRSAIVLPKAGDIYQAVKGVKLIFTDINESLKEVQEGPIESRLKVLRKISKGIQSIGRTLPIIFNQSADVVAGLGINTSWLRRVTGRIASVSNSLSDVTNKTTMVLNGAGVVLVDVRNTQGLVKSIAKDYDKILKAPWKQKFVILNNALGKVDKILNNTDGIYGEVEDTLRKVLGIDFKMKASLGNITNRLSGMIGNLSTSVKKVALIHEDIASTFNQIKRGPVQNIGKLIDETKQFVNSIKNYDIADILVLAPKFAIGKISDLKVIITESGNILSNISSLLNKHCKLCNFNTILGNGFVGRLSNDITNNLDNITSRVENVLNKIENASTKVGGIITSVKKIKSEVIKLKNVDFSKDGFKTISAVLHQTSTLFDSINNDSAGVFNALFSDNRDILQLQGQFGGFINQMSAFLDKAGNFSSDIADAFGKFKNLQKTFDSTIENFGNLTTGPIEHRVQAVKNIVDGVNSIMKGFPEILKNSKISPQWLRSFGTKLEGITSGISSVLNKTKDFASAVGETIVGVNNVMSTADIIGKDFKRLFVSGSVGTKINIAKNIVGKLKILTTQVNTVASNTSNIFKTLTGKTLLKTDLIGNGATLLLNKISNGLNTVADRYEKFRELSKSINEAFGKIQEDPIKFALEELPKVFKQASNFVNLISKDVKGIAKDLGLNLDKFNLDTKLVQAAKQFYGFAQNALGAIGSGQSLVHDFEALLQSKDFKDAMNNFQKVMDSGSNFMQSIDKLGASLFKKWDSIKGDFNDALGSVAETLGINLQEMGGFLENGLAVGGEALSIFSNIQMLLKIKDFSPETVISAANSILNVANSGIKIANHFGAGIATKGLQDAAQFMGVVTSVVQLYTGIKGFINWLDDACDITYKSVVIPKEISYVCLKEKEYIEGVKVLIENCTFVQKEVIRGYHEGKLCCSEKECVYMQEVACLKHNEQCLETRRSFSTYLPGVQKQLIVTYQNFHNASASAKARGKDVKTAEILLKRSELILNASSAALLQSEEMNKKAVKSHKIMEKQLNKISKMVHKNKSVITIHKAEFDLTTYKPDIKLLPIRLYLLDQANQVSNLDVVIDKDLESESFKIISYTIVASYVDYIPVSKQRRRRRSVTGLPSNQIMQHSKIYWATLCASYSEHYQVIMEIVHDLRASLQHSTNQSSKLITPLPIKRSLTESESEALLLKELMNMNQESRQNLREIIQTWRRRSGLMMSNEMMGTSCIGFDDCFNAFVDNMTTMFEPDMEDFHDVLNILQELRTTLLAITASRYINLDFLGIKVEKAVSLLMKLENKAIFCDEEPTLSQLMPMSVFAYLGTDFTLPCNIHGPASMEYIWRRNGTILPKQGNWKLELLDVESSDHGYYTCEGTTLTSKIESNKVLVRIFERLQLLVEPVSHVLNYPGGTSVVLYCNGTAPPSPSYKWWFKPYTALLPVLIGRRSILKISNAFSASSGQYWCELSNGYSTIISSKATIDIVKVMQRKESARLHLQVVTEKKGVTCRLPETEHASGISTFIKSYLHTKIGLMEWSNVISMKYRNNRTDNDKATLVVDISLHKKQAQPRDSVSFALLVSSERSRLQTKVTNFIDSTKKSRGTKLTWKSNCQLILQAVKFSVDWKVEELNCPKGMGPSEDKVKCVQCSPGKFDDGRGQCSNCPVGTYQPQLSATTCLPCGVNELTLQDGSPSRTDCIKTDFQCDEPMHLVVLIDSSENVSTHAWTSVKSFVSQLSNHMDLENVKMSVATFGEEVEIQISTGDYETSNNRLRELLTNLKKVGGNYRIEVAYNLADRMTRLSNVENGRYVVLFVTHNRKQASNVDEVLEISQSIQSRNAEIFTVLWNGNKSMDDDVLNLVSRPVFKHLFVASSATHLTQWSTVTARAICRNVL